MFTASKSNIHLSMKELMIILSTVFLSKKWCLEKSTGTFRKSTGAFFLVTKIQKGTGTFLRKCRLFQKNFIRKRNEKFVGVGMKKWCRQTETFFQTPLFAKKNSMKL